MKKSKLFIVMAVFVSVMLVSFGVQASGSITVVNDVFTGVCTATASYKDAINEHVSIEVIPADVDKSELYATSDSLHVVLGQIVYFNQANSNSTGTVNFEFPLRTSGKYTVRVHSMKNKGEAIQKNIDVVSLSDATAVWNGLVSSPADNLPELLEILGESDELILSMADDADLHSAIKKYSLLGAFTKENANTLISNIKSDCEAITFLRTVLNKIKSASNTTQIKPILSVPENADILGVAEHMERYKALKNTKIADAAVAGKTLTKTEFQAAFIKGIEDAEKAESQNSPTTIPPKSPVGTGGGSLGGAVSVPIVQTPVPSSSHPFNDISAVAWAKDAIASLYNEGIISGKSSNEFAPNDNITREEFVKIALGLMSAEPIAGATAFSDVDSSSWYASYVNAAVSLGIVSGYSDTQFGVGEYITRQDVAVILNRTYKLSVVNNAVEFYDESDISDYAKEAVEKLSGAGVINGSDGRFMPKSNCTRAEAACMVYRMMSLMKEGK